MIEFDADEALRKLIIIKYFRESLKPSIRVEIEQRGHELDSFEELVQKIVDAEAKAALQPRSAACETAQHYLWGTWPANSTAAKSQGSPIKDPRFEEQKTQTQEAAPSHFFESTESSEKAWKQKKKKWQREKWDKKDSTPAIGVNAINTSGRKAWKKKA